MNADKHRKAGVRTAFVGGGLLAVVALAGCAGTTSGDATTPRTPGTPGTNAAAAPSNAAPPTAAPPNALLSNAAAAPSNQPAAAAPPEAVAAVTPECRSSGLKLTITGQGADMSKAYWELRFTNTGGTPCVLVGFPGVSYVAGDRGVQVGPAAERSATKGPRVTLAPGDTAYSLVAAATTEVFDPAQCKPTSVRGFRVYPPDETASMFIALPGAGEQGCAGATPGSAQLLVHTVVPGSGA